MLGGIQILIRMVLLMGVSIKLRHYAVYCLHFIQLYKHLKNYKNVELHIHNKIMNLQSHIYKQML